MFKGLLKNIYNPMTLRQTLQSTLILILAVSGTLSLFGIAHTVRLYRNLHIGTIGEMLHARDTGMTLTDRHGEIFFTFATPGQRDLVPLGLIAPNLQVAVIAAEDANFFQHYGFSPTGIVRASFLNLQQGNRKYGGSTITQQAIKNIYLSPRKNFARKYREIILAFKLERVYTKSEILGLYLNTVYWGEGVFGAEAAAQTYFNTSANYLSLAQATLLAVILPAPTRLSPYENYATTRAAQLQLLTKLYESKKISQRQLTAAIDEDVTLAPQSTTVNVTAPLFALMVRDNLIETYGTATVLQSGMVVKTTLDLSWQRAAETAVKNHLVTVASAGATNAATVVLNTTSADILALVGSGGWDQQPHGRINMALAPRQTGSAFKPIVYAAALSDRIITIATTLRDQPTTFGRNYRPKNYTGKYSGAVTVRHALSNSLNIPAVQVAQQVSPAAVAKLASELGISTISNAASSNLSIALGTEQISLLELTNAFATFGRTGLFVPPKLVLTVHDKFGEEISQTTPTPERVIEAGVAYIISTILSDNDARKSTFGNILNLPRTAAVKTGTTQEWRDAWTVGYTPNLAIGVWVGNSDNRPMQQLAGATGAVPLWKQLMLAFESTRPEQPFVQPPGVLTRVPCNQTTAKNPRREYFLADFVPKGWCPLAPIAATALPAL